MRYRTVLGLTILVTLHPACTVEREPAPADAPESPATGTGGVTSSAGGTGSSDDTGGSAGTTSVGSGGMESATGGSSGSSGGSPPWDGLEQVLLYVDFEKHSPGAYTPEMVTADFENVRGIKVQEGRAEILVDEQSGNSALKVKYPRGCVGTDACAIQFRVGLPRAVDTAFIRYRLKFDENFEWVRGGKLPGLCGGDCNTGCVAVSGTDGWSGRMMWRSGGNLVQYMYYPGKRSSCGDDYSWGKSAVRGQWMEVKTEFVMNTPGQRDGVLRSWLDGEQVLNEEDFRFRDIESLKIDWFYFSTFYGGSSSDWAPSRDTFISYDDILVTTVDPDELPAR